MITLLRSKEIKYYVLIISLISVLLITFGFCVSSLTGTLIMITVLILCIMFYIVTYQRYKKISKLSEYLRLISLGNTSLDIRDNTEGELSILKNEIYKVTLMLSEYNEKLNREKTLLANQMADISHQLKTPITSMMVMLDLLRDENLPKDKRKEFTTRLHIQMDRIEWLVSSLLKMSKLDAGVVEMKKENIKAGKLIEAALHPLLITMELKNIALEVTGAEMVISCDIKWTTEALINIIKNCVEYTPIEGTIIINNNDNPLYAEIKITDSGEGIRKDDLPHVFTRFYRGKNASPDSVGIGLAMSQSILQSQQGTIIASSEVGKGSAFSIRFYKSII